MKVSEFYSREIVNYASYSTIRMIGSAIDGQKNAARKIIKTVMDKNITQEIKVSQFGSKISEYTEYLHGNIDGVIVTMAQNYAGTNNIPLLDRAGNFGTRFINDASASRYIYTNGSKELFKLINKDDNAILDKQFFEGTEIEPKFYLPTLPLILVNGSEGMATGFAQKILSRNPKKIKQYILDKLEGKSRPTKSNSLEPYFEGFSGSVVQGENPKQWFIKGVAKKISASKVEITEIPIGYCLKDYIKVLDKLEDDKVITSYKDRSDDNIFNFEVQFTIASLKTLSDDQLLSKLKLIKTVSENYTCINKEMKIQVFSGSKEIIDYYYDVKLGYLQKRKDHLIQSLEDEIRLDLSKYTFIKMIVEDKLVINKRKKSDIVEDLNQVEAIIAREGNHDYLLNMSIGSLTEERMSKLFQDIKDKKSQMDSVKSKTLEEMWKDEI